MYGYGAAPMPDSPSAMHQSPPMDYFDRVTRQAEIDRTAFPQAATMMGRTGSLPWNATCQPPAVVGEGLAQPDPSPSVDGRPALWASRHCAEDGAMSGFGKYVNRAAPGLCGSLETLGDPRLWSFGGIEALDLVYKGSDAELSKGSAANRPAPPSAAPKGDEDSVEMMISPESEAIEVERILTEERDVVGAASSGGIGSRVPSIVKSFTDASMVSVVSAVKQGGPASCSPGGACSDGGEGKLLGCGYGKRAADQEEDGDDGEENHTLNCGALQGVGLDEIQRNLVQFGRNVMRGGVDRADDDDDDEGQGGCGTTATRGDTDNEDYDGDDDDEDEDDYDITSREA